MNTLPRLAACAIAGGLAGAPASAQPLATPPAVPATVAGATQSPVPLRTALDAAWQRAIAARESDGQRRRADADRAVAARPWAGAPSLSLSHRDDRLQGGAGQRETEIGIAVPLWLPGQRAARAGAADAVAAVALATEAAARLRLAGEVREAAWALAALQAEVAQAEAQAQALRQLAQDVERRVRAGDLARADSLAAQAEHLEAAAMQLEARQRLQAARAHWTLLTGLAAIPDLGEAAPADATPAAIEQHPELQSVRQAAELARQRVVLMRHSRSDAPELTVGVRQDTAGRGASSQGSFVVGLRLPFGTDERNRPLEAAALSELDLAQAAEARLRERLASEVATARDAQRSAQDQFEAGVARARLLRERATLIEKSFRAGETPLPDLLRALAAAAQADGAVARQTAGVGLARARLQQALGNLP